MVRIPELRWLDLSQKNRVLVVEVSVNGFDWTTETTEAEYTFKPTPQITALSHYRTNLRADF